MGAVIQCGACQKRIRLPDNLPPNRQFNCPGCGAMLALQAPPPDPGYGAAPPPQPFGFSDPEPQPSPAGGSVSAEGLDADAIKSLRRGAFMHIVANGLYTLATLLLTLALRRYPGLSPWATPCGLGVVLFGFVMVAAGFAGNVWLAALSTGPTIGLYCVWSLLVAYTLKPAGGEV